MKVYLIPVHSFVDLITNSSSEIFVSADQKTVNAIRDLINDILVAGGSEVRADQMFDFDLVISEGWGSNKQYHSVNSEKGKEILADEDSANEGRGPELEVLLKPKITDSPEVVRIAERLNNITGLYSIDGWYNG